MSNRKSFTLFYIPNWVLEKGKIQNLSPAQLLNPKAVLDTLSKSDIDKYLAEQHNVQETFRIPSSIPLHTVTGITIPETWINLGSYFRYVDESKDSNIDVRTLSVPYCYSTPEIKHGCFAETASRAYRKSDGPKPTFNIFPELIFIDNVTIVMTLRRIDTVEDKLKLIENSIDTLLVAGFQLAEVLELPFGKYLVHQSTARANTLL